MSSPVIQCNLDFQYPTDKFGVKFYVKDTPNIRCWLWQDSVKYQPVTGQSCQLVYCATQYDTNSSPAIITGIISTTENRIDFVIPENTFIAGDYFAQVVLKETGKQVVAGSGTLHCYRSPIGTI
jgi:hypothetical protein